MHKSTGVIRLIIVLIKMRMDEWTDATDQLAASPRPGRSSNNTPSSYTRIIHHQDHPPGSSTRIILKDHPTTLYHPTPGSSTTRIILLDHPPGSSSRIIQLHSIILHQDHPFGLSTIFIHQDHPTTIYHPPPGSSKISIHQNLPTGSSTIFIQQHFIILRLENPAFPLIS